MTLGNMTKQIAQSTFVSQTPLEYLILFNAVSSQFELVQKDSILFCQKTVEDFTLWMAHYVVASEFSFLFSVKYPVNEI